MFNFALKRVVTISLSSMFALSFHSMDILAQDLSEAKKLCSNLTPANRAMAERAGYNVNELCSEIKSIPKAQKALPQTTKASRPTISAPAKSSGKPKTVSTIVAPVQDSGVKARTNPSSLKPFGYDLFANAPTTFAPAESLPVAADYLLGPGDTLDILFYGKINSTFSLEINREGFVDFPELGPVGLAGLSYSEAKDMLQARIDAQIVGTKVSITMGSLRTMQIFVLGEAHKPGAYTVSSLSTITHALVSSGGISDIGSLRSIQLKREGRTVAILDLYDLLLKGDTSDDLRLQAKDVVYIPTVGDLVSIDGQILRPAIYELKGGESIRDLISLSGGLGPKAFPSSAEIRRINDDGFMTVVDVNLDMSGESNLPLKNGDHLKINAIINENKGVVALTGHVYHPGQFALRNGMRASDLLKEIAEYKEGLDLDYAIITRTDPVTGYKSAVAVRPRDILDMDAVTTSDIELQDKDVLRLFSIDGDRGVDLNSLTEALRRQNRAGELPPIASVSGARLSGTFPITKEMRISDLIAAAGGLTPNYADLDYSLLVREEIAALSDIKVLPIDLRKALKDLKGPEDLLVQPKDRLFIFSVNEARPITLTSIVSQLRAQAELDQSPKVVTLNGTVRFPGVYPLTQGMTIKDAISAAGGFTESAYRRSAEIARLDLTDPDIARSTIRVANLDGSYDAYLYAQDSVQFRVIPDFKEIETISLQGEFVFPGVYAFEKGETLTSVIRRAGGFTDEAFVDGSIFLRQDLRRREQEELERLSGLLEEQISFDRLQDVNAEAEISTGQLQAQRAALQALSGSKAIGRLVIPLNEILNFNSDDIILKHKDQLLIPKFSQEVTVIGEVQRPTSFLFRDGSSKSDYLKLAGGLKDSADKSSIYVVQAGGEVVTPDGWFKFSLSGSGIEPGDTIVVPVDTDATRIRGIPLLAEVSTIIYQLALGAAAINTFNAN